MQVPRAFALRRVTSWRYHNMRTIGLIGGMSWESTTSYYQIINIVVKERLGGLHSAKCVLYSVDFHEIEKCQSEGRWDDGAAILGEAGLALERAGADFVVICTNTMHKVATHVEAMLGIPLLHIADATARVILDSGMSRVGLLGTAYTMEQEFYAERLRDGGLEVLVPEAAERTEINRVIYEELCLGSIVPDSRLNFLDSVNSLASRGAQGVILGCTEIGLLIGQSDTSVPLFDTARIHAESAALYALGLYSTSVRV